MRRCTPTTVITPTTYQCRQAIGWPSIGWRRISTKCITGLSSAMRARSATAGLRSSVSYCQTIGVMKNSSCVRLAMIGGMSRNRVATMPASTAIHAPLSTSNANAGSASRSDQPSGCGKITIRIAHTTRLCTKNSA